MGVNIDEYLADLEDRMAGRMVTRYAPRVEGHRCLLSTLGGMYGPSILVVYEDQGGRFWAGHTEYLSQVHYCPVCGTQARTLPES